MTNKKMLELSIQTDIGEAPKSVRLDGKLRGSSSSESNFSTLLREYALCDRIIMGTKAVTVNVQGLLGYISTAYDLGPEVKEEIECSLPQDFTECMDERGYWVGFWDDTSTVHHRDIMRYAVERIGAAVAAYHTKLDAREPEEEAALENMIALEDTLMTVHNDLQLAEEQLYTAKIGATDLSEVAKKVLYFSQGYQLSSVPAEKCEQLWRSQIARLQLDSGITKDQQRFGIHVPAPETWSSLLSFTAALEDTEIRAPVMEVPASHQVPARSIQIPSRTLHRTRKGAYLGRNTSQDVRIMYI